MFKSNKGYSLVEIGIGIIILVTFLFFSVGLINGCYTNYRRIKQRNIAIDRAVFHIEKLLQADKNVLTGFVLEEIEDNKVKAVPNPKVSEYVKKTDVFNNLFKVRYASSVGKTKEEITSIPTEKELNEYIIKDIDYVANRYIENVVIGSASEENLKNGDYGFLNEDGIIEGPYEVTFYGEIIYNSPFKYEDQNSEGTPIYSDSDTEGNYIASNYRSLKIVRRVRRIPAENGKAYGNNVLKVEVEVYYPKNGKVVKNNIREVPEEELEKIVISTIKTSN